MGRHAGQSAAETTYVAPRPRRARVLVLALVLTATLVAWGVLVYAAIDFGQEARTGVSTAWVLLTVTTVGAAACLFTTMLLAGRLLSTVRGGEPTPPRPKGGRRAAR